MREKLKKLGVGTVHRFRAIVGEFKEKKLRGKATILLLDIRHKKKFMADHLWMVVNSELAGLSLQKGERISFNARVVIYRRGPEKEPLDYALDNPRKISRLKGEKEEVKNKSQIEIKTYRTNKYRQPIRFDFENKTVWLTQAEISKILNISIKTVSRKLLNLEKEHNFDLQDSKMRMTINKREVNVYSTKYLAFLKEETPSELCENFLIWCQSVFNSKDNDDYKLVRFTQDILELEVRFESNYETAWLTQEEMAELYGTTRENITIHIGNILRQGELEKVSVCKKSLQTANDNKSYPVEYYNLDMILSIGYRVNSKRGIAFRKWANSILKDYLIKGFAINEKRVSSLGKTVLIQNRMLASSLEIDFQELSAVISEYTRALDLLDDYDHQSLQSPKGRTTNYLLTYEDCRSIIDSMKYGLSSTLFGKEKEEGKLEGILAAVYQNVFEQEVYPSLESKAAHLLYFLVKDHPFYDGCKRIAATLFLEFLNRNKTLIKNGQLILSNDALVAITLLTAESDPEEMEIIVSVIINILAQH